MTSIESQIREYLAHHILFAGSYPFSDHASFLEEGVLDSMGVMEVVMFASKTFGIDIKPEEVTPENFDSVSRLAAFIRRRQASGPEPVLAAQADAPEAS